MKESQGPTAPLGRLRFHVVYECGGDISFDNCFLVEEIRVIKDTGGPV
jgi:DNA-binding cell septation regulator SpoVG